jgi:hypothetical protein
MCGRALRLPNVDAIFSRTKHTLDAFEVLAKRLGALALKKGAELHIGAAASGEVIAIRFPQCADARIAVFRANTAVFVAMTAI